MVWHGTTHRHNACLFSFHCHQSSGFLTKGKVGVCLMPMPQAFACPLTARPHTTTMSSPHKCHTPHHVPAYHQSLIILLCPSSSAPNGSTNFSSCSHGGFHREQNAQQEGAEQDQGEESEKDAHHSESRRLPASVRTENEEKGRLSCRGFPIWRDRSAYTGREVVPVCLDLSVWGKFLLVVGARGKGVLQWGMHVYMAWGGSHPPSF